MPAPLSAIGESLSDRYRIERELGQGGMATVYLAEDLRHDRKVAIKVLKPELAAVIGADRFLAEIKTTANLQHPHILPLFDSGQADSFLFFVMPYVEGESLREKLDREKQLPVDEAVRISSEVADALEHAHGQGVIHRDIKPANLLLRDGRVQVADFGIALAVQQAGGARLTETGLSVGTPQYMSPEQATGDRELDGRSDLYSLGCVLYEMLAGDPPHTGSTAQAILSKILTEDPKPVREIRRAVPGHVAWAIERALEKLPADRFGTLGEFTTALRDDSASGPRRATTGSSERRGRLIWALGGAAVGALLSAAALSDDAGPATSVPTYLALDTPAEVELVYTSGRPTLAISPDGSTIAYVGDSRGERLYVQRLDQPGEARAIPGTEAAMGPFFSPDGLSVGFANGRGLFRVPIDGGRPIQLAEGGFTFRGGSWSDDGEWIYYSPTISLGVWRVAADGGGDPQEITTPAKDGLDNSHWFPEALPGGHQLIYTTCCGRMQVRMVEIGSGHDRLLVDNAFFGRFVPTGHLLYMQRDALFASAFDPETGEVGPAVRIADDIIVGDDRYAEFDIAEDGSLVYLAGPTVFDRGLLRVDRDGSARPFSPDPRPYSLNMQFSPDGERLALTIWEGQTDIFVYDAVRGDFQPVTRHQAPDFWPLWTSDGQSLVFSSVRSGNLQLYIAPADQRDTTRLLFADEYSKWAGGWLPGDTALAYMLEHEESGQDLWIYSLADRTSQPFLVTPFNEGNPEPSPDGRWLAFDSDQSGQLEIYVRSLVDGATCKVSTSGGYDPRWTGDGSELFYRRARTAMVVQAADLSPCRPQPEAIYEGLEDLLWAVHPSGDYFVTVTARENPQLRLVQHWTAELVRRVEEALIR